MRTAACMLASLLLAGCGQMAIDGEVVTVAGEPAVGARVTAMGSSCSTVVGEDGRFALPCQPGNYVVVITHPGFIEIKEEVEAPERERYDLGKQVMVAIPDSKGLFLFQDNQYVSMEPGFLARTIVTGDVKTRRYCLDVDASTATRLAPGNHAIFDNQTDGWRPFILDAEGCAYRDQRDSKARWEVTYKEKPAYEERTLEAGKKVAVMELPAGDYFIADWDQGFFTTDPNNKKHYTGYWIKVGG